LHHPAPYQRLDDEGPRRHQGQHGQGHRRLGGAQPVGAGPGVPQLAPDLPGQLIELRSQRVEPVLAHPGRHQPGGPDGVTRPAPLDHRNGRLVQPAATGRLDPVEQGQGGGLTLELPPQRHQLLVDLATPRFVGLEELLGAGEHEGAHAGLLVDETGLQAGHALGRHRQ
jgi:hypothetical protein